MFCDLHTHSTFSDGTFSPTEIVLKAKEIGLDAVALCDHNTVAGLDAVSYTHLTLPTNSRV
mgnify:CR=1 FL=1